MTIRTSSASIDGADDAHQGDRARYSPATPSSRPLATQRPNWSPVRAKQPRPRRTVEVLRNVQVKARLVVHRLRNAEARSIDPWRRGAQRGRDVELAVGAAEMFLDVTASPNRLVNGADGSHKDEDPSCCCVKIGFVRSCTNMIVPISGVARVAAHSSSDRWCAWRESNPLPCGPEPRW